MNNPKELLTKNRADLSQFLIHLTKDGRYEQYVAVQPGRFRWGYEEITAEGSLKRILSSPPKFKLIARSPLGYFKYNIDTPYKVRGGVQPDWLKCVCFSEAPLSELPSFYRATIAKRNEYRKFGLAFWQEAIRSKGGNPIFYFDYGKNNFVSSIDKMIHPSVVAHFKPLLPYFQEYGPRKYPGSGRTPEIDFRWEREWRIPGDLDFTPAEVAFGICPETKITEMEKLVGGAFPFLDPDWDMSKLRIELEKKGAKRLITAL